MKALKFLGNGQSTVSEVPAPKPAPGEVLIKTQVSAICGSERHDYLAGNPNPEFISGHEYTGVIVDANECAGVRMGDRVAVNVIQGCGHCCFCAAGVPQLCKEFSIYSGGHAEYVCAPAACCIHLPQDIPFDTGALIGGDTCGTPYRAVAKLPKSFGNVALVTGAGPIGLGCVAYLKFFGYFVIVSDPLAASRALACEKAGADLAVDPVKEDLGAVVFRHTEGLGADVILECSGNAQAQEQCFSLVRAQGTVVFVGENTNSIRLAPSADIIHKELHLLGSFYFTKSDFAQMYSLCRRGFDPFVIVTHRFPFAQAPEAFQTFFRGGTGKILLYHS